MKIIAMNFTAAMVQNTPLELFPISCMCLVPVALEIFQKR